MKARLIGTLVALLLGVALLPMPALAGAPGRTADSTDAQGALRADQCSPDALARLSAAIEDARTTWSRTLTADSYDAFTQARSAFSQRSTACSSSFSDESRPITAAPGADDFLQGPQSTSGQPYFTPDSGIAVDIRSSSDEAIAGLDVIYAVIATTGSSDTADSTNVSVSVTLPVATDGPQYVDDTGGCTFATPTLTCALGTIARRGASRSFLVRMSTPPDLFFDGTTTLEATASVSRTEADSVSADNSNTASTLVTEQSDLRIFKYIMPTSPVIGELAQYTIWVENRGPSTARQTTIRDTLLAGSADSLGSTVRIESCAFSVSQGGGAITQFTCTTGPLVGTQFGSDVATFSTNRLDPLDFDKPAPDPLDADLVQGRMRASFRLTFLRDVTNVNMAAVESETPDPDTSDNNAETFADVLASGDIALTKIATGEEQQTTQAGLMFNNASFGQVFPTAPNYFSSIRVTAGRRIQYQITVSNPGAGPVDNVVLTDRLPAGVRIYQGTLQVTSNPSVANPGRCVTGTPGDPSDPLVCGLGAIRPATGDFDSSIPTSRTVSFEVVVDADVAAGSVLENDATVSFDGIDLNNTNNRAFAQNTVLAAADAQALKVSTGQNLVYSSGQYVYRDLANQVTAGHVLRSSITVQNNGPSDSQNVTLYDQLPDIVGAAGIMPLTFLRADNADCRPDAVHARDIYCSLGTMAAGERRTFDIYTQAHEAIPNGTVLANCATVQTGSSNTVPPGAPPAPPSGGPTQTLTWDPLTTGNQSCTNVTVNQLSGPALGLAIDKSGPSSADSGDDISYTLTATNSGPGSFGNVVVTDYLPAGLSVTAVTPSQGACNTGVPGDSNRPLVCNLGTVAAGGSATITVEAKVTAAVGSVIFNDVQVTSSTSDPNNADNIDTVSTSVTQGTQPDARIKKGSGSYVGNDIYNLDGTNQSRTGAAGSGGKINFYIQVENEGPSDSFTFLATGAAAADFAVKYFDGTTEITADVVAGTFTTPVLAPGETFVIKARVKVKSSATSGQSVTRLVTVTSVGNGSNQDAVLFTGSRK